MKKILSRLVTSQDGFAHFAPLIIIIIFMIVGVFFLVSSKAEQTNIIDPWDLGIQVKHQTSQPPTILQSSEEPSAGTASNSNRKEHLTTPNWAGVVASIGKYVKDARGEIIVPQVKCKQAGRATTFWVGIGGYNGVSVQQTGFDVECDEYKGKIYAVYFAWWEVWSVKGDRQGEYRMSIRPGQHIAASVHNLNDSGNWYMQLRNLTTGATAGKKINCPNCDIQAAEWVVEKMGSSKGGVKLAEFKSVTFKNLYLADDASKGKYVPLYKRPYHAMSLANPNGNQYYIKTKLPSGSKTKSFKSVYIKH